MAERFTSDLLFIIFVLLIAAFLGFLIGYLLRKSMKCKKCEEWEEENISLKSKIKKFEDEDAILKNSNLTLQEEINQMKLMIEKLETENLKTEKETTVTETVEEITEIGEDSQDLKPLKDDLKIVLGIGPKISRLLNNRGIFTWKQLSETDPGVISEYLLNDGGERYRIHNPSTWPHQARLADEGKWDELKDYQNRLEL